MQALFQYPAGVLDWTHLRSFLAVHREGSLAHAARVLRMDATTVGRHVTALEESLGQPLFVRGRPAWTLTPAGERILPAAEQVEEAAQDVVRRAAESEDAPTGRVRLSTHDVVATRILAPVLPALRRRHPGLRLDVLCTPRLSDLLRGEADLALRTVRPVETSLVARRVTAPTERPYASRAFLQEQGLEASVSDLTDVPALTIFTDEAWAFERGARLALRTSSASMLIAACVAGAGVAVLPDAIIRDEPELVPLDGVGFTRERHLWLCMHRDLARVARVRAVADFLVEVLTGQVT